MPASVDTLLTELHRRSRATLRDRWYRVRAGAIVALQAGAQPRQQGLLVGFEGASVRPVQRLARGRQRDRAEQCRVQPVGAPASKPGLDAGARDRCTGYRD